MEHKRVVVVGGGIVGCSILYHLAKAGWTDVLLLERSELTSGSTWHAAGNLFALTRPSNAQRLQMYTIRLYLQLEKEIGHSIGFHRTGGLHLAASENEVITLANNRARARRNGVDADWIDFQAAADLAPILDTRNLKRILWEPEKGSVDPSLATNGFATAAKAMGATIHRHSSVIATEQLGDGGWLVRTSSGEITCDVLVNAAGLWAREVGALAGIYLPLMPVEHHYLVTDEIPELAGLNRRIPVITESEAGYYSRQEGLGLLLGAYENKCRHWAVDGTPSDFGHELLPNDLGRMEQNFTVACDRMPALGRSGVKSVINGPMIFSPDLGPLIGPHPALRNYYCAVGVMTGFNQGGGIGKTLAEWIIDGEPEWDVNFWDVARFGSWAGKRFTFERTKYYYENRQERPFPHLENMSGRPVRTFPAYDLQKALGAVFGLNNGWEQPLWFARPGEEARDVYGYSRQNWFETVAAEARNVRENAGVFEISTFAKYRVCGRNVEAWLRRILAGRIPRESGRMSLSPMLSPAGKIIGDFTVTRTVEGYLMLGAGTMQGQHMRWFAVNSDVDVSVENLSDQWFGLMIAGPKARAVLERLVWRTDVSNSAFPFLSMRRLELKCVPEAHVFRVSFSGELGYEIYGPMCYQRPLYEAILREGDELGLRPAGSRALNALRIEKAYLSWNSELSPDYTVADVGLDWTVDWKRSDFIGHDAALSQRDLQRSEVLCTLSVDVSEMDCSGGEPVFLNNRYAGYVSSGAFGSSVGRSLALAFLKTDCADAEDYTVEINGVLRPARPLKRPAFDPEGTRNRT
ncbi:FAD-dependent oxidoreductase [Mesorhizobium australafricanum]|uniref:FAD-dependent oxidoreductase n=1 Tax=Mesorhizobium australafricanum TaxID=3072311 RepID=A0ABU4X5H7_9HYPH|nr:FAD-dependent oxidoreductase [Mesorhizobium sp. VK3E]MDX8443579.1 FAD-dependent oxidoreductase [Mesorhizobium sp. VK3E]